MSHTTMVTIGAFLAAVYLFVGLVPHVGVITALAVALALFTSLLTIDVATGLEVEG